MTLLGNWAHYHQSYLKISYIFFLSFFPPTKNSLVAKNSRPLPSFYLIIISFPLVCFTRCIICNPIHLTFSSIFVIIIIEKIKRSNDSMKFTPATLNGIRDILHPIRYNPYNTLMKRILCISHTPDRLHFLNPLALQKYTPQ